MIRPCFLVIDQQFPGSISTRKLVIETASLNVITAYSAQEGIETLSRFPRLDGVVLDSEVHGLPCHELIERLHKIRPDIPIVTVSPSGHDRCGNEDYHVSSYDPRDLLGQLHKICPEETLKAAEETSSHSGTSGTD
jgi:DNA-binding NtrC family response regulator